MKFGRVWFYISLCWVVVSCSRDVQPPRQDLISSPRAVIFDLPSSPRAQTVHVYPESDAWVVELQTLADDGFPDLTERGLFSTSLAAYGYAQSRWGLRLNEWRELTEMDTPEDVPLRATAGGLWTADKNWDWNWEVAFGQWLRSTIHPDFFQTYNIANDCADAYYQARMIFARMHKLPVSFRLASGNAWLTQNTLRSEWKKLPTHVEWHKDRRFLKALDYIAQVTYTHTLARDVYPVKLAPEALIEGTAYLTLFGNTGHTLLVNEINSTQSLQSSRLPMYTLASTVPKEVRPLFESFFYNSEQPLKPNAGYSGFVRFRWPRKIGSHSLISPQEMPYFSEEQYAKDLLVGEPEAHGNFSLFIFRRLNPQFNPVLRLQEGLKAIAEMFEARKQVVSEGFLACRKGCKEGSLDYENWSTPSRDKRIRDLLRDMEDYQKSLPALTTLSNTWQSALKKPLLNINGSDYLLQHLLWTWRERLFTSDPNKVPDLRWGLTPESHVRRLQTDLLPWIEARQTKLLKTTACNGVVYSECQPYSRPYMLASPLVEDLELKSRWLSLGAYCRWSTPSLCADLENLLRLEPSPVSAAPNLLALLRGLDFLNADPWVSEDVKWGLRPNLPHHLSLEGMWYVIGYENSKALLLSMDSPNFLYTMIDTRTQTLLWQSRTSSTEGFHISEDFVFQSKSDKLSVFRSEDLSLLAEISWTGGAIKMVRSVGSGQFTFAAENGVVLLERSSVGFTIRRQWPGHNSHLKHQLATVLKDDHLHVLDFASMPMKEFSWDLKKTLGFTPYSAHIFAETPEAALITWIQRPTSEDWSEGHLIFTRHDQQLRRFHLPHSLHWTSQTSVLQRFENKTDIHFLNARFETHTKKTLNGRLTTIAPQSPLVQNDDTVYRIDETQKNLAKLFTVAKDYKLHDAYESLLILKHPASPTAPHVLLVDAHSQTLRMSSTSHLGFSSGEQTPWVLPLLISSHTVLKNVDESMHSTTWVSFMDPLNWGRRPLLTDSFIQTHATTSAWEDRPLLTFDTSTDFIAPAPSAPGIIWHGLLPALQAKPLRLLTTSTKTYVFF